jgi:outer membrane protein TolC
MRTIILLALLIASSPLYAQVIDYNKIILPSGAKDISVEERLVQIAWLNNPTVKHAKNQVSMAENQLRSAKAGWLNLVQVSGNLNEFTIRGRDYVNEVRPTGLFYPRYNIGASLPLGRLITLPSEVKTARTVLENEHEEINILKLQIRADVLKAYSEYKTNLSLFNIQRDITGEMEAQHRLVEVKFRNGETTSNEYNASRDRFHNQRVRLLTAENDLAQSRYNLEQLIGVSVDEVL